MFELFEKRYFIDQIDIHVPDSARRRMEKFAWFPEPIYDLDDKGFLFQCRWGWMEWLLFRQDFTGKWHAFEMDN